MQALYEGSCSKCNHLILVGQDITGSPRKWAHRHCPGEELNGTQNQDALPGIEPKLLVTSPGRPGKRTSGLRV